MFSSWCIKEEIILEGIVVRKEVKMDIIYICEVWWWMYKIQTNTQLELKTPFGKFAGYRSMQSFHVLAKTLENKNTIYNDTRSYIHKD